MSENEKQLKDLLDSLELEYQDASDNEIRMNCPFCDEDKSHFYINKETLLFSCKKCGTEGNWYKFKMQLGKMDEVIATNDIFAGKQEIDKSFLEGYEKQLDENDPTFNKPAFEYLTKTRGFSVETIKKFRLGADKNFVIFPQIKDGVVWNLRFKNFIDKDFRSVAGQPSLLFNMDGIDRKKRAIVITEGETDCIAAYEMGVKNVVGITLGGLSFPIHWIEFFKGFKEIYICLDNDLVGRKGARRVAEKLGALRCKYVTLPVKDVNDYLLQTHKPGSKDFTNLLLSADKMEPGTISSISDYVNDLDAWFEGEGTLCGHPIPFTRLNSYLNGFKEEDLIVLTGVSGCGKCHGKGTKILMYDGSIKNVEDVKIGDQLMGDDSTPRNVLSLAKGKEEMYKIWDKKNPNDFYTINKSHILSLKDRHLREKKRESINDVCFKDYLKYSKFKQRFNYGYRTKVEFEYKKCPLDPYYTGLWLGDGNSRDLRIYNPDIEIINYLEEYAKKLNLNFYKTQEKEYETGKIRKDFRMSFSSKNLNKKNIVRETFKKLNLFNNKHIPDIYKFNNRKNRLELLAGLLDSDGYCTSERNGFEITQKNDRLANDIVFLARSLGFNARMVKCRKGCQTGVFGIYNRITIYGNIDEIPTKVERKQARKRLMNKDCLSYRLNFEYIGIDDYYGFVIDGNHRYILGDFSVTHNTTWSLNVLNDFLKSGKKCFCFFLEGKLMFYILRMMSIEFGIDINKLREDKQKWEEIKKIFSSYPLYFYSGPQSDIDTKKIVELTKATVDTYDIDFIAIDNLQEFVADNQYTTQNTATAVTAIKKLAVDTKKPILLIAHVKNPTTQRKRVTKFDLKNGSATHQKADIILALWNNKKDNSCEDNFYLSIEKNRMGVGNVDIKMVFQPEYGIFSERVDSEEIIKEEVTKFKNIKSKDDNFKSLGKKYTENDTI
jgi:replicative DNA helicase